MAEFAGAQDATHWDELDDGCGGEWGSSGGLLRWIHHSCLIS